MSNFESARQEVKAAEIALLKGFSRVHPLASHEVPEWLETLEAIKGLCILLKLGATADEVEDAIREIAEEEQ